MSSPLLLLTYDVTVFVASAKHHSRVSMKYTDNPWSIRIQPLKQPYRQRVFRSIVYTYTTRMERIVDPSATRIKSAVMTPAIWREMQLIAE